VSPFTVVTAYDQLVALGRIVAHASSGFFVTGSRSASPLAAARQPDVDGPLDAVWLARSNLEINDTWVAAGGESLPGSWMDDARMECLPRNVARGNGETLRASNSVQGSPVLREALALHLKFDGIFVDPNCLVVTDCATQALDLICRAMLRSGDLAVIEEPASPMLISHLRHHGARIVAVRRHVDGLDLEALEALCKLKSPTLVFTQSALHDPTG
jgi:DNA-binding transcriptional MocR family regulator